MSRQVAVVRPRVVPVVQLDESPAETFNKLYMEAIISDTQLNGQTNQHNATIQSIWGRLIET